MGGPGRLAGWEPDSGGTGLTGQRQRDSLARSDGGLGGPEDDPRWSLLRNYALCLELGDWQRRERWGEPPCWIGRGGGGGFNWGRPRTI